MTPGPRPFLEAIGTRAAGAVRQCSAIRVWPAGSILFHAGDPGDRVLIIEEGQVKLVAGEANGAETVLAVRRSGELLGELSAIDSGPRSATAVALGRVQCLVIPVEDFRRVVREEPDAAVALLQLVAARLREAEGRRAEHAALDTVQRLARRLLELAGDSTAVVGLNQDDLAALIGGSRESVARALQNLRRAGLVRTGRRQVELLDRAGLMERARTS